MSSKNELVLAKRRLPKVVVGQYFMIPRKDGNFVKGQVVDVWLKNIMCVAIFDELVKSNAAFRVEGENSETPSRVIALPSVATSEIIKGHWPLLNCGDVVVDWSRAPHNKFRELNFVGAEWHSGSIVENFVNAYYGLIDWNFYPKRPDLLKSFVRFD